MKILLAVDGSLCSSAAVNLVASRPWPPGSVVRIVYVCESAGEPAHLDASRPFPPAPYAIEKALARFEGTPLAREAKILHGRPTAAILAEVQAWDADLVVVGAHGMSAVERFVLGSVSLTVAAQASCSVEIVRIKDHPPQPSFK